MAFVTPASLVWLITGGTLATCLALVARWAVRTGFGRKVHKKKRIQGATLLRFYRNGRGGRLKRFFKIANEVLGDVESALSPPLCSNHARSFLPILTDVKRHGQKLLSQQTGAHRVSAPDREKELGQLILRLTMLEQRLKALPKPNLTIEQVLLGNFE